MLGTLRKSLAQWIAPPAAPAPASNIPSAATIEAWKARYAKLRGSYDAARTTDDFKNYWANSDRYDADSAHSPDVRHTLIARSRYEINNNGYADGIAQTYATDLVGVGPTLRMQTGSTGFNQMVEQTWFLWCKSIGFRRKFWCMAHAKHSDGEAFGVIRRNPGVKHPIKLDVVLHEAEQVQSWAVNFGEPNEIDGLGFDEFGNPETYYLLPQHPGANGREFIGIDPEEVPAEQMLHWFKLRRPGQHRAVPECASTLNTGAAARRWREATIAAAETAADLTALLKTNNLAPGVAPDEVAPMSEFEMQKRMMLALPQGWDVTQMSAEHPNATFETFHKALINEQARPKSMPYNKAACDSSSYNYASGRLDHQTYYASLDVEREDANDLVLDKLFDVWFDLAVVTFGWLGGDPAVVSQAARLHTWDWPKHRVADVEAEANAIATRLKTGQAGLQRIYSDQGLDIEDEFIATAATYGVTVEELRQRLFDVLLPPSDKSQAPPASPAAQAASSALISRIAPHLNGVH